MMKSEEIFGPWDFNCRCSMSEDYLTQVAKEIDFNRKTTPTRIIRNGPATIVMWKDGTKTIVKKSADTIDDPYGAFCAALAKKVYGSNSRVHKLVAKTEDYSKTSDGLAARLEKALDSLSENLKRIKR